MPPGTVGQVLASLPERRNRYVLYSLARHAGNAPVELEVLARDVAALERGESPDSVSEEAVEKTLDDLSRFRLPSLAYRGLVDYDPLSGLVGRPPYSVIADTLLDGLARLERGRFLNA